MAPVRPAYSSKLTERERAIPQSMLPNTLRCEVNTTYGGSMKLRPDFAAYMYDLRHRQFCIIFDACPVDLFDQVLELGAGWRGIHGKLLATRALKVVSTDYKPNILEHPQSPRIEYRVCDAEQVAHVFPRQEFDLVFSSNLLEHLPDYDRALQGIRDVLKDDGITIHAMPSPFFKVVDFLCYYPGQIVYFLEGITKKGGFTKLRKRVRGKTQTTAPGRGENNLKLARPRRSFVRKLLWPAPHGISKRHRDELYAFSARRWKQEFTKNGFTVVKVTKGPVASGHGWGLNRVRRLLERLGLTSEYIYIAVKTGQQSPYTKYF